MMCIRFWTWLAIIIATLLYVYWLVSGLLKLFGV
jgi:hypothetical protein